jgi:hypothetical protein
VTLEELKTNIKRKPSDTIKLKGEYFYFLVSVKTFLREQQQKAKHKGKRWMSWTMVTGRTDFPFQHWRLIFISRPTILLKTTRISEPSTEK